MFSLAASISSKYFLNKSDTMTCSPYMRLLSFPGHFHASDPVLRDASLVLGWTWCFVRKWYFIGSKGLEALAQMLCFIQSPSLACGDCSLLGSSPCVEKSPRP